MRKHRALSTIGLLSAILCAGLAISFALVSNGDSQSVSSETSPAIADAAAKGRFSKLAVKPGAYTFPKLNLNGGQTSSAVNITLSNSGTLPLHVTVNDATSPFSVFSGLGAQTIQSKSSTVVRVRFQPVAAGKFSSRVSITSDATKGKTSVSVSLKGSSIGTLPTATPKPTPTPTLLPTPTPTGHPTPTRTGGKTPTATPTVIASNWRVLAWNDLGMHCLDPDYGVFAILPPFNVLHAQVIDSSGHLVTSTSSASTTYEALADPADSINTTSIGKTEFWMYTLAIFGANIPPDMGVAGFAMPGPNNIPQTMEFDSTYNMFVGLGIPIIPKDDAGHVNFYPMMKVVAHDASGNAQTSTGNVLPVSDEMNCVACHASNSDPAAKPTAGWVNNPNPVKDYRLNVLLLHDEKSANSPLYQSSLTTAGYPGGLYQSALGGNPPLCAKCHLSNALAPFGITGVPGVAQLTTSVHGKHSGVIDPTTGLTMDSTANRTECYRCHPGSATRCLRGVMGNAVDASGNALMQCQSCHGNMAALAAPNRQGWLDEPTCQNCHTGDAVSNNGEIRYTSVFDTNGQRRVAVNDLFATTPNIPAKGLSLYRFSSGHGGLQCEACHGSTHAEYPSSEVNDNQQSIKLQGHSGMLIECQSCHVSGLPAGPLGGPHGIHAVGQSWVNAHSDFVDSNGSSSCQSCHGRDYRGTVLSVAQDDRSFTSEELGQKLFKRGDVIGCYSCHNGPNPN